MPKYLGDGVYASHDGFSIWLTTSDGIRINRIALEPEVYAALVTYHADLTGAIESSREPPCS